MDIECIICYEKKNIKEFILLTCCLKQICNNCRENINTVSCPFCRTIIFKEKIELYSTSSYDNIQQLSYSLPSSFFSNIMDSRMSRIDRHRQKRYWKLQERELEREYNRNLTRILNESKSKNKKQINYDILQDLLYI